MKSPALSRRSFLKVTAFTGSGLVLGCVLPPVKADADSGAKAKGAQMTAFVQIDPSGSVTITAPRPECGTGVRTVLPMIIAEELGVDWKSVKIVQAPGDGQTYGNQVIGGSQSVRTSWGPLRLAGATAALMLRQAAAKQWGVDVAETRTDDGHVVSKDGKKKASFGSLAEAAAKIPVPDRSQVTFKDPSEYTILGKSTKRVDNLDVVTGKSKYGFDVRLPGMKFAVIARPVEFGGGVGNVDDSAARQVPGVVDVFTVGNGVAVVADSTWAAIKGREALKVEWSSTVNSDLSTAILDQRFKDTIGPFPDMPAGGKVVEAVYELPYLSHAVMEPMNCTADVRADGCDVWAPTQVPDSAKGELVRMVSLPEDKVVLHVPLVGGGFGRRLSTEYVGEAVSISKRIGKPVQVVWSRDDDMRHDHYRPATYHACKGSVSDDGMPVAFYHQLVRAGGRAGRGNGWRRSQLAYTIANDGVQQGAIDSPVPTGAWRSVDATFLNFVHETFLDELIAAGGKDPYQTRLALMPEGRLKGTLKLCGEKAGWGKPLPAGWGRGVACFQGFASYVTQIAEVEVKPDGSFKIHRVVAVADVGRVLNPLGAEAQVMGATMDAIATLLYAQCTIKGGGVEQTGWSDFGWTRMADAPAIEVNFVNSTEDPTGLGEPGYPAVGPAIVNAIFAASGKRLRKLPIGTKLA